MTIGDNKFAVDNKSGIKAKNNKLVTGACNKTYVSNESTIINNKFISSGDNLTDIRFDIGANIGLVNSINHSFNLGCGNGLDVNVMIDIVLTANVESDVENANNIKIVNLSKNFNNNITIIVLVNLSYIIRKKNAMKFST